MRKMFLDRFNNTYTLEKELNAPPERYIEIYEATMDECFIETYQLPDGLLINIAYSTFEKESGLVADRRYGMFEENGYKDEFMQGRYSFIKWSIPPRLFKKYWDMFIEEREE